MDHLTSETVLRLGTWRGEYELGRLTELGREGAMEFSEGNLKNHEWNDAKFGF